MILFNAGHEKLLLLVHYVLYVYMCIYISRERERERGRERERERKKEREIGNTNWLSDRWITADLCLNHPWVLYFGLKFPFYVLFELLLYETTREAYE